MSAVYEHLLPDERNSVLSMVWALLNPGGVLFLFDTPHRFFPIENHTTGLPLVNYLPDRLALHFTRRFSRRIESNATWESLLRRGIRGGTVGEILSGLQNGPWQPVLLEPARLGMEDQIDIWYELSSPARLRSIKKAVKHALKAFKLITGVTFVPSLSLAVRKI